MLDRYELLDTFDFDYAREVHDRHKVELEPAPKQRRAASVHSFANCFDHPDFRLFYFTYSDVMSLKILDENADHWMALPVHLEGGTARLLDLPGRLDSHGTQDPLTLPALSQSLGLCVKEPLLQRHLTAYLGEVQTEPFEFRPGFDLQRAAHRAIAAMVIAQVEEETRDPAVLLDTARVDVFLEAVVSMMLHYCPHSHSGRLLKDSAAPATRDVKRVLDYIHCFFAQPISLAELVSVAGVPGRTLNQHFRVHTGLSPMAYLQRTRLRNARRSLLKNTTQSVTDVALECGITHLGRFSASYKAAFGELPSETLRGRRLH